MRMRIFTVLLAVCCGAATGESPDRKEVEQTLRRALDGMAAFQTHGGWGRAYTTDGALVFGEWRLIPASWITMQPPATPKVAEVFLRAGRVLKDEALLDRARRARDAMRSVQTALGGFPHDADTTAPPQRSGTFDDDTTTAVLDFFIEWWRHTGNAEDLEAVHRIGQFILTAQYPASGGWPQSYPPHVASYGRYITFNDRNMSNIISALLKLHTLTGEARYLESAVRGGECILRLQGGPGEEIWAQQYDPDTLEPAWARKFEPPGYSPAESLAVCDTLIELYLATGDERFLDPLPRAFGWYDSHRLPNGKFARLYEPGTQRPVYGRRDRAEKVYDFEKACTGYSWQGDWYPARAREALARIREIGREAYLEEAGKTAPPPARGQLAERVRKVCGQLSEGGWWTRSPSGEDLEEIRRRGHPDDTPLVQTGVFCANAHLLLDYIEAAQ